MTNIRQRTQRRPLADSVRPWLLIVLVLVTCFVLVARPLLQTTSTNEADFAAIFPPAAMIYLESKDFLSQLKQWSESSVKQRWLQSDNFSQFEKSRLYLRLHDKLEEFNSLLELSVDLPLVRSLAGHRAALGLYDIRDLEFVFATTIPGNNFEQGPFFRNKTLFERRSAEGGGYFSRNGQGNSLAFAVQRNIFFLATNEGLLRTALHNFNVPASRDRLSSEALFQDSQKALPRDHDLWMVLNMGLIQNSRYFRNEWIHHNLQETSRYRAGVVRMEIKEGQYKEERQFLLKEETTTASPGIDPFLLQNVLTQAEYVKAEVASAHDIATTIYSTLLNPLRPRDQTLSLTRSDSPYEIAPLLKSDNRYFLQIDEPVPASSNVLEAQKKEQELLIGQLEKEIEKLGATSLLRCEAPRLDSQGYYRFQRGLMFNATNRDVNPLKRILESHYNRLYLSGSPAQWKKVNASVDVLGVFPSLATGTRASLWCLGNSEEIVGTLLNAPKTTVASSDPGLRYYSQLDLARFRAGYDSLFEWLDFQARPRNPGEAPAYFSRNLGSLIAALSPVKDVSIRAWLLDKVLHEELIYRLR